MTMTNNNFDTSSNYDVLPKQFLNYINYELNLFEKITNKKFFFNILSNNKFELSSENTLPQLIYIDTMPTFCKFLQISSLSLNSS